MYIESIWTGVCVNFVRMDLFVNMARDLVYHITAVVIVSIWGLTFVSTKYLLNGGLSPTEIFFIRFSVSYLGILAICHKRLFCDSVLDEFMTFLTGLFGGSLYFIVENIALKESTASNVSLIVCTAPIFTVFITSLSNGKRLPHTVMFGLAVSVIGVFVLLFKDMEQIHFSPAGDLLALFAAVLWSTYTILLGHLSGRYSPSFITRKTFFYGVLTALPVLYITGGNIDMKRYFETGTLLNLLFLSIIASLMCNYVWTKVIKRLGPVRTGNYLYLNPVAAVLASVLFLGETFDVSLLIGMLLVFGGIYFSNKKLES